MSEADRRRPPAGYSLAELVVAAALGSLVVVILILLYSQTQRVWILGQTQIDVDSDARRVFTQIERRVVMAQSVATFGDYPNNGYVALPSPATNYYASSYGYILPTSIPTTSAGSSSASRVTPYGFVGLPYPSTSPTPASSKYNTASTTSDILYMAVPHTSTNPTCASSTYPDLYFIYADPTTPTQLRQTIYMCYAKSVSPLPITDASVLTGGQVLNSADYESTSPRTSILTDKLDPARGFTVTYPTSTTIDITLKVKKSGTVFGRTVSNTYTTRIYTRNR